MTPQLIISQSWKSVKMNNTLCQCAWEARSNYGQKEMISLNRLGKSYLERTYKKHLNLQK